jgi:lysophospholipase L1-like esterase
MILPYEFQVRKNNRNQDYLYPQNIIKKILLNNNIEFYDYTIEFCNKKNANIFFLKFDPVHLSKNGYDFVFKLLKKDLSLQ